MTVFQVVATRVSSSTVIHHSMGEYRAARGYYERAARSYEALLGAEHPCTLVSRSNLAALDKALGLESAVRSLADSWSRALRNLLGESHPVPAGGPNRATLYLPVEGRSVSVNLVLAA